MVYGEIAAYQVNTRPLLTILNIYSNVMDVSKTCLFGTKSLKLFEESDITVFKAF